MLLSITTTHQPATDLGYLLAKHPAKCQEFTLSYGKAQVFYPEVSDERCTATLMLELDPVALVCGSSGAKGDGGLLAQYVNDRPYVASSFLSVAIAQVYGSALKGNCKGREELADSAIPLVAELPVVPSRGGEGLLRSLFEPLGYAIELERLPLDERFPAWGESSYFKLKLSATTKLSTLLSHLYVLLPVLDNDKHYWVGDAELEKLLARGEGWLESHPAKDEIVKRYLKHQRGLARQALARLVKDEEADLDAREEKQESEEAALEKPIYLNDTRMSKVHSTLNELGGSSVADLGCGEGKLLSRLVKDRSLKRIVGMDVSNRALEIAHKRVIERLAPMRADNVELLRGSLTYRDARLSGFDAICAIEVIEHMELDRLPAFERLVFEFAQPKAVLITTPNAEYNVRFPALPAGRFRHRDHRFEWTRAEFEAWSRAIAERHGYSVRFEPIGEVDDQVGAPTQMGVFTR